MIDSFDKIQVHKGKVGEIDYAFGEEGKVFYNYTESSLPDLKEEVVWQLKDMKDQGVTKQGIQFRKSFAEWCLDNISPEIFSGLDFVFIVDDEEIDCNAALTINYEQPLHIGRYLGEVTWS